ncbi:cell wall-binding repeat-containing protein [Candidatus Poriferisodalis sp.]|uniref:cell wall-binding repeat-containing protein n=1 Tax=Candidatus Poriferisodalis sp. TaxID=3101277 RepID=UPI003B5C256C
MPGVLRGLCVAVCSTALAASMLAAPSAAQANAGSTLIVANGGSLSDVGTAASLVAAGGGDAVVFAASAHALGERSAAVVARFAPDRVVMVGGTAALTDAIYGELRRLVPRVAISRHAGADRIDTAARAAAGSLTGATAPTLVVANGWSLSDVGTAASAVATGRGDAVLYAESDDLGAPTRELLRESQPDRVLLVGGAAALAESVAEEIRALAPGATVERLGGATRIDTAALSAQRALEAGATHAVVAYGWSDADVGIAAALAASDGNSAVLYAVSSDALGTATAELLGEHRPSTVTLVGAPEALAAAIEAEIAGLAPEAEVRRLGSLDVAVSAGLAAADAAFRFIQADSEADVPTADAGTHVPEPLPEHWLDRLNAYRAASGLLPVTENSEWSAGIVKHLEYLRIEGPFGDPTQASSHHREDPTSPHFTIEGHRAGQSSNLSYANRTDADGIDSWMRAPFHGAAMLHPLLERVALGRSERPDGRFDHGLDVNRGRSGSTYSETVVFPGAGSWVPLTRFTGERPNPLDHCPGYQERPSAGLPLIILFPTSFRFAAGATAELRGASGQHFRTLDGNLCTVHAASNRIFLIANEALEPGEWKATFRVRTGQSLTWCFGAYEPSAASVPLRRLGGCEEFSARPALQSSTSDGTEDGSQSSTSYTAVSAANASGSISICVLRADGFVECSGRGQARNIPDGPFTAVDAGFLGSCGLRPDGRIECWGDLYSGQTYGGIPEVPQGTFTSLDVGRGHSCAVRSDGAIKCWADNYGNEHGQADPPAGAFTDVAAGWSHTCGIRVGGSVECWGGAPYLPEILQAPSGSFTAITAGSSHTCGLRVDGTVHCWSGISNDETVATPAGEFTAISSGRRHVCGIRPNGTVECWGYGIYAELDVPAGHFISIAAGEAFSCGIRANGELECWGGSANRS